MVFPLAACRPKGGVPAEDRLIFDAFAGGGQITAHAPEIGPGAWAIGFGLVGWWSLAGGVLSSNINGSQWLYLDAGAADVELQTRLGCGAAGTFMGAFAGKPAGTDDPGNKGTAVWLGKAGDQVILYAHGMQKGVAAVSVGVGLHDVELRVFQKRG